MLSLFFCYYYCYCYIFCCHCCCHYCCFVIVTVVVPTDVIVVVFIVVIVDVIATKPTTSLLLLSTPDVFIFLQSHLLEKLFHFFLAFYIVTRFGIFCNVQKMAKDFG